MYLNTDTIVVLGSAHFHTVSCKLVFGDTKGVFTPVDWFILSGPGEQNLILVLARFIFTLTFCKQ